MISVRVSKFIRGSLAQLSLLMLTGQWGVMSIQAQSISVPNGSFESPTTDFVTISLDAWQKSPKPSYFDENATGFLWIQTTGQFLNTPVGAGDHLDNTDGKQAAFLLSFPLVWVQQELGSAEGHYQPGLAYELTVGINGRKMEFGNSAAISLYYRDASLNEVTVASKSIDFINGDEGNSFVDYSVRTPVVSGSDDWAGKSIGIRIQPYGAGLGYLNVDNVRLSAIPEPGVIALAVGGFCALGLTLRNGRRRW